MSLVSLADMKTYLGEVTTTYDTFLQEQLDLISLSVENYCGRKFAEASYTQTFYKGDFEVNSREEVLYTFHYPITTLTSITEYSPDDSDLLTVNTEYRAVNDTGKIYRIESGFKTFWLKDYDFDSYVTVAYDAGYTTIPVDIQGVVKELVEERYNKKVNNIDLSFGSDVQRVSIPGTISVDFDYTLQANERKAAYGMFIGNYANVLDFYRSERPMIGQIKDKYVV